jgi:hypothetical protein
MLAVGNLRLRRCLGDGCLPCPPAAGLWFSGVRSFRPQKGFMRGTRYAAVMPQGGKYGNRGLA